MLTNRDRVFAAGIAFVLLDEVPPADFFLALEDEGVSIAHIFDAALRIKMEGAADDFLLAYTLVLLGLDEVFGIDLTIIYLGGEDAEDQLELFPVDGATY